MPALICLWAFCHLQQIEKQSVSLLSPSVFAEACGGGVGGAETPAGGRTFELRHSCPDDLERPFSRCVRKARHGSSLSIASSNF